MHLFAWLSRPRVQIISLTSSVSPQQLKSIGLRKGCFVPLKEKKNILVDNYIESVPGLPHHACKPFLSISVRLHNNWNQWVYGKDACILKREKHTLNNNLESISTAKNSGGELLTSRNFWDDNPCMCSFGKALSSQLNLAIERKLDMSMKVLSGFHAVYRSYPLFKVLNLQKYPDENGANDGTQRNSQLQRQPQHQQHDLAVSSVHLSPSPSFLFIIVHPNALLLYHPLS